MAFQFVKVFVICTFIKAVILSVLLYHDTYDDPAVWYMMLQTITSVVLIVYRDTHLHTAQPDVLNVISPIVYAMRTVTIGLSLETWRRYNTGRAVFAFFFILIFLVELVISIAAGITVQTYNKAIKLVPS